MNGDRQGKLSGNDLPKDPSSPLPEDVERINEQTADIVKKYRLSCQLDEALERMVRGFLEEVIKGKDRKLLKSEDIVGLIQNLFLYARYQRFDAGCWRREAEKLRQRITQGLPQETARMEERLNRLRVERRAVLADLKGIKQRRRNKRRRR